MKQETRQVHLDLEHALPLGQPDLTLAGYGRVLQAFSAVIPALEDRLTQLAFPAEFDVPGGLRAHLLRRDLKVLGLSPRPPLQDWRHLTRAEGLGALYVLEGSRLGSMLITRGLARMNITPESGGAYFAGTGDTPRRWKAFQAALEQHVRPEDEDEVLNGAHTTFAAFQAAWEQVSAPVLVHG